VGTTLAITWIEISVEHSAKKYLYFQISIFNLFFLVAFLDDKKEIIELSDRIIKCNFGFFPLLDRSKKASIQFWAFNVTKDCVPLFVILTKD